MASIPFPSSVAAVGRQNIDSLIQYTGNSCWFYKVATRVATDPLGTVFNTTYAPPIQTKVVIVWKPEIRLLMALGLYTEDQLPILAYFQFANDANQFDYIELDVEYAVGDILTNKFEITDKKFHGYAIEQRAVWVIAPRRKG